MAELKRKDEELTTADIAGRSEKPQLVRNEQRERIENAAATQDNLRDTSAENTDPNNLGQPRDVVDINRQRPAAISSAASSQNPLFSETEVNDSRTRWSNIQAAFVDEPRRAVEDADTLVASLMKKLAEGFATEREKLEKQWDRGEDVSTEDLRIALQRYRSFFDRLLKV